MLIIKILISFLICFMFSCFGQTENPATWPTPTPELINNGYYTKEKLMKYWEWKEKTLPDLYLMFNDSIGRINTLKWEKSNFQHRFYFKELGIELIVDHQPSKKRHAYVKTIGRESVDTLDIKNLVWLKSFLFTNSKQIDRNCDLIETLFRDIFIVTKDSRSGVIKLFKSNYCNCLCDDDEIIK